MSGTGGQRAAVLAAIILGAAVLAGPAMAQQAAPAPPADAQAAPAQPAGMPPGMPAARPAGVPMYVNPLWLALIIISVCFWLYVTSWVGDDARGTNLDFFKYSALLLAAGGLGMILTLLVHAAFGFLTIALVLGAFSFYIVVRNKTVPEKFKFLGREHRARLLAAIPVLRGLPSLQARVRTVRASVPLRNESGQGLDDLLEEDASLAEPAGILMDLIVRGAATGARRARLQPAGEQYIAQYVLDGVLQNVEGFESDTAKQVIGCASRFVGLAKDGRMKRGSGKMTADLAGTGQVEIEVAVSASGGQPVLQLGLPNWTAGLQRSGLEALGMHEVLVKRVKAAIEQKKGALIVSGPPGSGRTTTLYSVCRTLDVFATDIVTLEATEEFELEHIRRWTMAPERPFAQVYQQIVREGPQVLMFGEIETEEHARTLLTFAVQEGELLTSFESDDAPDALLRLVKLAGGPDLVNRAVTCAVAQRLVRKLCTNCREEIEPNPAMLQKLGVNANEPGLWYRPVGCEACLNSGYHGQTGIFAMLIVTEPIKELLTRSDVSPDAIQKVAGKAAFRTMYQDGVAKVTAGITTIEEVRRALRRG